MRTVTGDCGRTGQSREGLIGGREELLDRFLLIGGKGLEALLSKPGHERACQLKFGESGYLLSEDFDEAALDAVEARLRALNPLAPITRAERSNVPLDSVLGVHAFDLDRILEVKPDFVNPPHGADGHVHDEHCGHDHHHHDHDHGHDHHDHDQDDGPAVRAAKA